MKSAGDELSQQEQEQLYVVLSQYGDVFADNSGDLGKTEEIQHTIDTRDAPPVRQPSRRIPVAQQEEVNCCMRCKRRMQSSPQESRGLHQSFL